MSLLDLRIAATVTLGWSEADFLSATPRILLAAMDRHAEQVTREREERGVYVGTLAAATYNAAGVRRSGGSSRPWTASDFFDAGERYTGQSAEQIKDALVAWQATVARAGGRA